MEHVLVPKHEKLTDEQKQQLFSELKISLRELPKISSKDPAIAELECVVGDVIRITRSSATAGEVYFYRGVSDE